MTEPGSTHTDIEARSDIARFLGRGVWPADKDALLETAAQNDATDAVLARLQRLPEGETFENMQAVAYALGIADPEPEGAGAD